MDLRNLAFNIDFKSVDSSPVKKADKAMDDVKKSMGGIVIESDKVGKGIRDSMKTSPIDKMKVGLKDVKSSLGSISKSATKTGKKMMLGLTTPIVAFGTKALHTVSGFDDAMANVQKISGATGKEFDLLRDKAKVLGATTAYSASEASDGMGILAASGMKVNDILVTSEDMFNLMSAGSVSAETSASVLTNTMAQFNLGADKSGYIVDTFAATSAKAKVSVDDLEHSMAMAGGTLASMNMDVHQSTSVLGHLANAGTPVQQIGTIVNAMGREIKSNADKFKKIGINVYDPVTGKLKDMGNVMGEVEQAVKGKTDAERDSILSSVFSGQAMKGATDWINQGSEAYAKLTDEIIKESNAAKMMADIQENTIGGAFRAVKSATEGFMIEIGDVIKGPLQNVALFVADLAGKFGKLSDPMKKTIIAVAGVAAAAGPLIWIFGKIAGGIAFMISPVGAVIAAVVGLGLVFVRLWKTNEAFRDNVIGAWETIKDKLGVAIGYMQGLWEKHGEKIKSSLTEVFDRVSSIVMGAFQIIGSVVVIGIGFIVNIWNKHGETIKSMTSIAWNLISGAISGAMTVIQGIIDVVLGVIQGDWSRVWEGVKGIFEGVMERITAVWNAVKELMSVAIKGTISAITDKFNTAMDKVREKWESLKTFMSNPIKGTVNLAQKGVEKVKGWVGASHKTGLDRVPVDNYAANLHKDEMILTSKASDEFRAMGGTKDGLITRNETTTNYNTETVKAKGNQSGNVTFNPTYNITLEGTASEKDKKDIENVIDKKTRELFNIFFKEMNMKMA